MCNDLEFAPLEGYEPPTGSARPRATEGSIISELTYKLSEDPDDQKDGLWIWGLFKEPLYPYCLLEIKTNDYSLGGDDSLPPMTLFAKLPHKMEKVKDDKEGRRQVRSGWGEERRDEALRISQRLASLITNTVLTPLSFSRRRCCWGLRTS